MPHVNVDPDFTEEIEYFYSLPEADLKEGPKPSEELLDQFAGVVPDVVRWTWERYGFCSFGGGRTWLCNPLEWQDAVDAWLDGVELKLGQDKFVALGRTAFGELILWGERVGSGTIIAPIRGEIFPMDMQAEMGDEWKRNNVAATSLSALARQPFDVLDDESGKPLFDPCLKKLGPLDAQQMYTFAPAPALGGKVTLDSALVEQAVPQIILLAALDSGEIQGDIAQTLRKRDSDVQDWIDGQ